MLIEVSSRELSDWKAYFSIKKKQAEKERREKEAKQKAKGLGTL